jgi:hypothetical protein
MNVQCNYDDNGCAECFLEGSVPGEPFLLSITTPYDVDE